MFKAKYVYKYPQAPVDREKIRVSYNRPMEDTIARLETVTEDIGVNKRLEDGMFVVEAEEVVDFYSSAGGRDIPRDGLVLELLLTEGSGTTVHDTSGYNNNGTIYGATWERLDTGKWILKFDGIDDYGQIPDNPTLNFTQLTICFWIRTTETRNWRYPLAKEGSQPFSAGVKGWRFNLDIGGKCLNFDISKDPTNFKRLRGGKINDGDWHFIVAWWDGTEAMLYVDMELKDSKSFSGDISNTKWISIASSYGPGAYCVCDFGLINMYNRPLADSEINEIYTLTKPYFVG